MTDSFDVRKEVEQYVERARNESQKYLKVDGLDMDADTIAAIRKPGFLDGLIEKLKAAKDDKEKKEFLEDCIIGEAFYHAVMIQDLLGAIDQIGGTERLGSFDPWWVALMMYKIGFAHAELHNHDLRSQPTYRAMIHARWVPEIRYADDRDGYALAIEEAEKYWQNGGTELHHVVAKRLWEDYLVNENGLKKRLAPIARKYGRCFGEKGSRKIR